MNNYIVTAIYDGLHGTSLGGRASRGEHYRHSFKSISKITDAEYTIYTNEYDPIKAFMVENVSNLKYDLKTYDLNNSDYSVKINNIKDVESTKSSSRCIELQYSKFTWIESLANLINEEDYIYWFDAGLSYSGLIPDKHLGNKGYHDYNYYSPLFNNQFFNNLISYTDESFFCIAKDNVNFFWDGGLPDKWYINGKDCSNHIIGGLFGGKSKIVKNVCSLFRSLANNLLDNEHVLYSEENILTVLYYNHNDLFKTKTFDIWWHENNIVGNVGEERAKELLSSAKSFYHILEELQ